MELEDVEARRQERLHHLSCYPLCDFFLRRGVECMTPAQVVGDLAAEAHKSLLQHFSDHRNMDLLETLFRDSINILRVTKEQLKRQLEYNLDSYNMENFESARGLLRLIRGLSELQFSNFALIRGQGLADVQCRRHEESWFIEAKTLILQYREEHLRVDGTDTSITVDKFQPVSRNFADYVDALCSRLVDPIRKAQQQLAATTARLGQGKTMIGIVVNWFAADLFLHDEHNVRAVYDRLQRLAVDSGEDWFRGIDALTIMSEARLDIFTA